MVSASNGTAEDAEELFSEAVFIYLSKKPAYLTASLHTYICSVARRLWLKELRRRKIAAQNADSFLKEQQDFNLRTAEEEEIVLRAFENLPESFRGKQILNAFYFQQLSMKEIAHRFGLPSENAAKKQKFHAIHQLRSLLRQQLPEVFDAA